MPENFSVTDAPTPFLVGRCTDFHDEDFIWGAAMRMYVEDDVIVGKRLFLGQPELFEEFDGGYNLTPEQAAKIDRKFRETRRETTVFSAVPSERALASRRHEVIKLNEQESIFRDSRYLLRKVLKDDRTEMFMLRQGCSTDTCWFVENGNWRSKSRDEPFLYCYFDRGTMIDPHE